MRPSAWLHRYRWRIALILGALAGGLLIALSIKVAVAYPALAAALIAGVFAWGQWHTARQKLILDLFDRRYRLYAEFKSLLMDLSQQARPSLNDDFRFRILTSEMKPLFGNEVVDGMMLLTERYHALSAARMTSLPDDPEGRSSLSTKVENAKNDYSRLMGDIHRLVLPYLRMDQKLPRPPQEWPAAFSAWLKRKWDDRPAGE